MHVFDISVILYNDTSQKNDGRIIDPKDNARDRLEKTQALETPSLIEDKLLCLTT